MFLRMYSLVHNHTESVTQARTNYFVSSNVMYRYFNDLVHTLGLFYSVVHAIWMASINRLVCTSVGKVQR